MTSRVWQLFLYRTEPAATVRATCAERCPRCARLHGLARRCRELQPAEEPGRALTGQVEWVVGQVLTLSHPRKEAPALAAEQIHGARPLAATRASRSIRPRQAPRSRRRPRQNANPGSTSDLGVRRRQLHKPPQSRDEAPEPVP